MGFGFQPYNRPMVPLPSAVESLGSRMIRDLFIRTGQSERIAPRGTELEWSDAAEGALIIVLRGERSTRIHEHDSHDAVTALWNKRAAWMTRWGYR